MGRHSDENGDDVADYAEIHPYLGPDAQILAPPPDPDAVDGVVPDGSVPVPIKAPGEPMRYRRDVRRDDAEGIVAEMAHVTAHLSSVADTDDDPDTHAGSVQVRVLDHADGDPGMLSIIGTLDAEPSAHYLRPGYDPDTDDDGTRAHRYSEADRPGEPA